MKGDLEVLNKLLQLNIDTIEIGKDNMDIVKIEG